MDEQRQHLIDRIKQAQNILVTVSANPSVDQLAAAIGLTLGLNKLDKHGTAVFSGQVPNTLEFLKPGETLEKNTDSLRDFIIALDKSKADKLRYKVEDNVVRIFITPYRTSLSENDLQFSQGDFNVDVVVCLGVTEQQDLDTAITAHGRILHDATVVSVSTQGQGSLGSINWVDPTASSLSEMMVGLVDGLDKKLLDGQIATALLTGIVATTDRFRNEKTTPKTMSASAELMAAGANQQLIASELESTTSTSKSDEPDTSAMAPETPEPKPEELAEAPKAEPGMLEIDHDAKASEPTAADEEASPESDTEHSQIHVDDEGRLLTGEDTPAISGVKSSGESASFGEPKQNTGRERMVEPPKLANGDLTANTEPEKLDPPAEELTLPPVGAPLLNHDEPTLPPPPMAPTDLLEPPTQPDAEVSHVPLQPAPDDWRPAATVPPTTPDETLTEIERAVHSPHVETLPVDSATGSTDVDSARSAVEAALQNAAPSAPLEPVTALNAQPLGPELRTPYVPPAEPAAPALPPVPNTGFSEPTPGSSPADETLDMPLPSNPFGPGQPLSQNPLTQPGSLPNMPQPGSGPTPPPPVPPPPIIPPAQ